MIASIGGWPYVLGGWGIAAATFGVYTVMMLRRGRALSRRLPPEDRRWM